MTSSYSTGAINSFSSFLFIEESVVESENKQLRGVMVTLCKASDRRKIVLLGMATL